jgi:hypothetical protein
VALLIIILVTILLVGIVAGVSRYLSHFRIAERAAARIAEYKIENASPDDAFNDPQLRALIACPGCGARGQFEVTRKKQCVCQVCSTTWDAR